jgi:hypothetical protein
VKNNLLALAVVLMMVSLPHSIDATYQHGDNLIFAGETLNIPVFPFEQYREKHGWRPHLSIKPNMISSANGRGYVATWEIADGKLWLTGIEAWIQHEDGSYERASLPALFPSDSPRERVLADWFTGKLVYPGYKWGSHRDPSEEEQLLLNAKLVITVNQGAVSEVIDRRMK